MATGQPNLLLKEARENIGLTQPEIAERVGVDDATYYGWEHGNHIPYLRHRQKLATIFNISMAEVNAMFGQTGSSSGTMTIEDPRKVKDYIVRNFRLRLLGIVDAGPYRDQQSAFSQITKEFDAMNTADDQTCQMTRRQAIRDLAVLPFVVPLNLAERIQPLSPSHYELFIKECGASLAACEELLWSSEAEDLALAFECVSRYLVELKAIIASASRYRQQAQKLAASCAILKTRLGWGRAGHFVALPFAQEAVNLSHESGDICLQLSARSKLSWFYLRADQRELALDTATQARDLLEKHKAQIPVCIRGGTYSTLSVMQAKNELSPDTALKKASEQGSDNEVRYLMDFREVRMFIEQGQALCYAGKPDDALKAYAQILDLKTLKATRSFQGTLNETNRLEALLAMAQASLEGKARNMDNAMRYWKAAIEGAKRLKHEGKYSIALAIYDDMKIAFPGEREVHNLRDHFKPRKGSMP